MTEPTRTSFICSFCGLRKEIKFLSNILAEKADLAKIEKEFEAKENEVVDLNSQFMATTDDTLASSLIRQIKVAQAELQELAKRAERSKREICSLCFAQGAKRVDPTTFNCEICKVEKRGGGLKRHIAGWEEKGIHPWRITLVCRQCQNDYAFNPPADFYCPLTSNGRDYYDSNFTRKFDCSCEVPKEKR